MQQYAIWDWPVRIFHWMLVLLFVMAWISAEMGEMEIHLYIGSAIGTLLLFRLMWGVWGSHYAQFRNFVTTPRAVIDYIQGRKKHTVGHNPLGGYSVVAMLLILLLQVTTGLFGYDDILFEAPLYHLVSEQSAALLMEFHEINFNIALLLVGLHIAAIVLYRLRGTNLILPMLRGYSATLYSTIAPRNVWWALLTLALALILSVSVWLLSL